MATLAELEDALVNADKAGDNQAAQALADEIVRMRSKGQGAQATQQTSSISNNGLVRGMMDPIDAGAQFLDNALPDFITKPVNRFNNWLVDKGVPLDRVPEGGVNQQLKEQEAKYQKSRAAAGETGFDGDRLVGNLLSPANLAIASKIPQAASIAGRVLTGTGSGAVMGGLQPVTEGDYWNEFRKQVATGAAVGGALPLVTGAVSRVIKPKSSPEVQMLMKEGVTPTPGQALGGFWKTAEEKARSLPLTGDAIAAGQKRALEQYNRSAVNRVLRPIGQTLPKNVSAGAEAISYADDVLKSKYDDLLPKLGGALDGRFQRDIQGVKTLAQSLPSDKASQLNSIIDNEITARFTSAGRANGHTLKEIESKLGGMASGYKRSLDYDQRRIGDAIEELQSSLRKMIERNNPAHSGELKKINTAYAQYKRVERAMSYTGKDGELFTPSQYNSAVKALDRSKDKKLFSQHKAFGQDFADAGKSVLANKYPDSGTAGRLTTNALALGGGAWLHPGTIVGAGLASIPYLPGAQKAFTGLVANGPLMSQNLSNKFAAPIAQAVKKSAPYLTYGATPYAYGLLNE